MAVKVNGFDYESYEDIFNEANRNSIFNLDREFEKGYVWLNKIMPTYRTLLIFLSAFTCFTYYWIFRNYIPSKYYWLGFGLIAISGDKMLLFQMSGLRNAITINILALSIPLIKKRRIVPYIVLIFLGYLFHTSALLFMPLAYLIATPNRIKTFDIIIWSLFFIFFVFASTSFLINYLSTVINLYFDNYNVYTDEAKDSVYERSILLYGILIYMFTISFAIMRKVNLLETEIVIFKLSLFFLFSLALGSLNIRMSHYFAPYLVLSAIIVLNRAENPLTKYAYLGAVFLFLFYSFIIVYLQRADMLNYQYESIFDY